MKITKISFALIVFLSVYCQIEAQTSLQKIEPVNFSQVAIEDNFWKPRIYTVSTVTIPVCINQTEVKTARIRNFEKVAAKKGEAHEGIYFVDQHGLPRGLLCRSFN